MSVDFKRSPQTPVRSCHGTPSVMKSPHNRLTVKDSPQTPKSSRSRGCWLPQVVKVGGSYSLEIIVKTHAGKIGPFSASKSAEKYRKAFGSVVKFEIISVQKKDEKVDYFVITNEENQTHHFRQDGLFMFLKSSNPFTQLCQGIISDGSMEHLAKYFTCLAQSKGFTKYMEEVYTEEGMVKEKGLEEKLSLMRNASNEEFLTFIKLAKECAIIIGGAGADAAGGQGAGGQGAGGTGGSVTKQKRISDFYAVNVPPKKMNKAETIEHHFNQELISYEPVDVSPFRTEDLNLEKVMSDLRNKYFPLVSEDERKHVELSWDRLCTTLINLPNRHLPKMKLAEMVKQATDLGSFPQPYYVALHTEPDPPALRGEHHDPPDAEERLFKQDARVGIDVVLWTLVKSSRPWVGRVHEILNEDGFLIHWFERKTRSSRTFSASMGADGSPYLSKQAMSSVMFWQMSVNPTAVSFNLPEYEYKRIMNEYASHDMCYSG